MGNNNVTLQGIVSGRVQGVFFRAETQRRARELGLSGWVRNLADGRVELLISGPEAAIEAMQSWLAQGPPLAAVQSLELERVDADPGTGFKIRG